MIFLIIAILVIGAIVLVSPTTLPKNSQNKGRGHLHLTQELANITKHIKKGDLLTPNELKYFTQFNEFLEETGRNYRLFSKIRAMDLVKYTGNWQHKGAWSTFSQKHIDFCLTSSVGKILACIELDDSTHNGNRAQARDNIKDNLLGAIGITLKRQLLKSNHEYKNEIKTLIEGLEERNFYYEDVNDFQKSKYYSIYQKFTRKESLLTGSELHLYKQLNSYIHVNNLDYLIFCKVRLSDIATVVDNKIITKLNSKEVNFVITDKSGIVVAGGRT